MKKHEVVSREKWFQLREKSLKKEKEITKLRDAVTAEVRDLPWIKIDKNYSFATRDGTKTLLELFEGKSQLVIYHFMLGTETSKPCTGCSFWADHFEGLGYHLPQKDVSLKVVSRAPLHHIMEWREKMGWGFDWVSSGNSEFNFDLGVSNREKNSDSPGMSIFYRDGDDIYQTYFTSGRGMEPLNGTYGVLDLVPKGRDEGEDAMKWVKRHTEYAK